MNTLALKEVGVRGNFAACNQLITGPKRSNYWPYLQLAALLLIWAFLQRWMIAADPTIGYIDPSIWLLVLLSVIFFFMVTGLCWWLLQRSWVALGLPAIGYMVLQFKQLEVWQQLGFYWLVFASLLFAAVGVLAAIC